MIDDYLETEDFLHDFQNRKRKALNALFEAYFERLYLFAYQLTDNEAQAEDIAIKAFKAAYFNGRILDQVKKKSGIVGFLYTTARNASYDYNKTSRRVKQRENAYQAMVAMDDDLENAIREGEVVEALYKAMENLPEECGKVLHLLYYEGLKYQEAADRLGISINTVKTHRRVGLAKLRVIMTRQQWTSCTVFVLAMLYR